MKYSYYAVLSNIPSSQVRRLKSSFTAFQNQQTDHPEVMVNCYKSSRLLFLFPHVFMRGMALKKSLICPPTTP